MVTILSHCIIRSIYYEYSQTVNMEELIAALKGTSTLTELAFVLSEVITKSQILLDKVKVTFKSGKN